MKWIASLILCAVALVANAQGNIICRLSLTANPIVVAQRYGISLTDLTSPAPFALFTCPNGVDPHVIQQQMIGDPDVVWAEDDGVLIMPEHIGAGKGSSIGAVGDRNDLYGYNDNLLSQIHFDPALSQSYGRSVRVGVLDTGVSPLQPGLWLKTVASMNAIEPSLPAHDWPRGTDTNGNNIQDEGVGHGTMVAGLIDQIAPKVDLVVCRVADSDGIATAWTLTKGIAFAVVNGAEILNISLGSSDRITAISDVLDWAAEYDVLPVAAIGNNGLRMSTYPAGYSKSVCVTGVDPNDIKASFSNWESDADLSAPATGLKSFWWDGTLGVWSGTSFATPLVTGAIADCMRRTKARLWPEMLMFVLQLSGDNIDSQNPDYEGKLGWRLNIAKMASMFPRQNLRVASVKIR